MADELIERPASPRRGSLLLTRQHSRRQRWAALTGQGFLLAVTSLSIVSVLFIFAFIVRDAWPFFRDMGVSALFGSSRWYPSMQPPEYGTLAIFFGSLLVTAGAMLVALPLGLAAAVCLSDILPFSVRQMVKPFIEMLAAIPSVVYGFFAVAVFAPFLQARGGPLLAVGLVLIAGPLLVVLALVAANGLAARLFGRPGGGAWLALLMGFLLLAVGLLAAGAWQLWQIRIASGTNALNAAFVLGLMALPTVVSVAEDALQAVGREMREGSYALGATRAETILRAVIPAAFSGLAAAVILGVMRAVGETMVVWMASGNTARIPEPWYSFLQPVRTLTATIAGDMGEAARGTMRYHVLFAMALALLVISFLLNLASQWIVQHQQRKLGRRA